MNQGFRIAMKPVAYGRPRCVVRNGKPAFFTPERTRAAINMIRRELIRQGAVKHEGAVSVDIIFYFATKTRIGQFHIVKPDLDNCVKLVIESGIGILFDDDSQVVHIISSKLYSDEDSIVLKTRQL